MVVRATRIAARFNQHRRSRASSDFTIAEYDAVRAAARKISAVVMMNVWSLMCSGGHRPPALA